MSDNINLDHFIRVRIEVMFALAAKHLADDMDDPEDNAGIPLAMFEAQEYMLNAWAQFLAKKVAQNE